MALGYTRHTGVDWIKKLVSCSVTASQFKYLHYLVQSILTFSLLHKEAQPLGTSWKLNQLIEIAETFHRFFSDWQFFWWFRIKYEFSEVDSAQTFLLQGLMLRHQFTFPPFQRNLLFKVEHSKASGRRESSRSKIVSFNIILAPKRYTFSWREHAIFHLLLIVQFIIHGQS